ncbi:MAG: hypothetical protein ACE5HS_22405 [bacterium]
MLNKPFNFASLLFISLITAGLAWVCSDGSSFINGPVNVTNGYAISIDGVNFSTDRTDLLTFTSDTTVVNLNVTNYQKGRVQVVVQDTLGSTLFSEQASANRTVSDTLKGVLPESVSITLTNFSGSFSIEIRER